MKIEKLNIRFKANPKRVVLRYFKLSEERIKRVFERVKSLDEFSADKKLQLVYQKFNNRHYKLEEKFYKHFTIAAEEINFDGQFSKTKEQLAGAYFSYEYSIEAAALFNPSIVVDPRQTKDSDNLKFIMSLRAVGDGHISSIEFREGKISSEGINIKELTGYCELPEIKYCTNRNAYKAYFDPNLVISDRVLFPQTPVESMGMEDVRFVEFIGNGEIKYYGTYTAYNGKEINIQLIETTDFTKFKVSKLFGDAVKDKGFALFPEKVNGKYCMIGRQDGENLYLMFSENIYQWDTKVKLDYELAAHEFIQTGNCGSPIKTDKGWLLLTHSVGAVRTYTIGAILLDLNDPSKIIGKLESPLIEADEDEREGYVPNVVYTCGALQWQDDLYIPYAQSDSSCSFAKVKLKEIVEELINQTGEK